MTTAVKTYLRHFFTTVMKLRLIIPKINKKTK